MSSQTHVSKPHPKSKFTKEEDATLTSIVAKMEGKVDWFKVAQMMPGRNQRQCKERWTNYLSPSTNRTPFTPEEDILLLEKYNEFGAKWVLISKFFNNRSDINIKSRYLVLKRRGVTLELLRTHSTMYFPKRKRMSKKMQQIMDQNLLYQQQMQLYQQQMQQLQQMQQMQLYQQQMQQNLPKQEVQEQNALEDVANKDFNDLSVDNIIGDLTEATNEELGNMWSLADIDTETISTFDFGF